ncbi:MAG: hypothetical protein ACKOCV_04395 [Gemmatimonadota bacterium]
MDDATRKYLAEIGRRGGMRSRRTLSPDQARAMVAAREAKRRRGRVAVRVFRLGEGPTEIEAHSHLTPAERFLLVRELTSRLLELAGQPWPTMERGTMPVRVHRP